MPTIRFLSVTSQFPRIFEYHPHSATEKCKTGYFHPSFARWRRNWSYSKVSSSLRLFLCRLAEVITQKSPSEPTPRNQKKNTRPFACNGATKTKHPAHLLHNWRRNWSCTEVSFSLWLVLFCCLKLVIPRRSYITSMRPLIKISTRRSPKNATPKLTKTTRPFACNGVPN